MCGIVGIKGIIPREDVCIAACDALRHRGPNDSGLFYAPTEGIMLGHRRLSILDLSAAGKQPFQSEDGRYQIVFNGEIYNYLEIKEELQSLYHFKTKTDTEVLLAAYSIWREKCLEKFNGMFAFAIWDSKEQILFCARDRLGEKPFFYAYDGTTFSFASEIKSLLALGISRKPNNTIIFDYLYYGLYDHTDQTFFEGIQKLPAAHYLVVKKSAINVQRYWHIGDAPKNEGLTEVEVHEKFKALLEDSIKLRFRSDVPVGLNLSSGLDSNSLYHYSNIVNGTYPISFSMCMPSKEYDECEIIEGFLSEEQKNKWNTCVLRPQELFPLADKMNHIQDEPYGGIPTIAYAKLNEKAQEKQVTVLLEGQGLDEILAGYKYYEAEYAKDRAQEKGHTGVMTLSQDMTQQIFPEILDETFIRDYKHSINFDRPFDSHLLNAQYRDLMHSKLPRVLRFNDHVSMAYGRELRLPYLDHRIVEFCFWLPPEYKMNKDGQKVLMRDLLKDHLPQLVQSKQKKSFGAVQTEWFRKYFKREIFDILESESFKNRPYWNHVILRERVEEFFQGKGDNSFFLWQCINLELWFRTYID